MIKRILSMIILGIILLTTIPNVHSVKAEGPSDVFSVKPILTENQDPNVGNYFSLKANGKTINQDLKFLITNLTNKEIKVRVFGLNALTSPSGEIQYVEEMEVENAKLLSEESSLIKYLKVPDKVTLKPNEKKEVTVNLDATLATGTLLGSVGFQLDTKQQSTEGQQFGVISEFRTVIGVLVKTDEQPKEKFIYDEIIIHPMSNQFTIKTPISLSTENLIKDVLLTYKVIDKDGKELFSSKEPKKINFAPNSKSSFFLPWELNKISKGTEYKVIIDLDYTNSSGEKSTDVVEKEFKYDEEAYLEDIGNDEVKSNNLPDVVESNLVWISLSMIILIIVIALIGWNRHRNNVYILNTDDSSVIPIIDMDNDLVELLFPLKDIKKHKAYTYYHYYKSVKYKKEVVRLDFKKTKLNK